MLFKVPFYQTSESAQVTPEALVVANFSADVLPYIQFGQDALFVPGIEADSVAGKPLTATVVDVDTAQGQVLFVLTADRAAQSQLYPGLSGQVRVVVRKRSPLSLLLESAGMR